MTGVVNLDRSRAALALAGVATVGAWSLPAAAMAAEPPLPEHGQFVESSEFDDTEYCAAEGVPSFHVVETIVTDYTVRYNSDGSLRMLIAHHDQHDTFTANGKTLQEDDHWTDFFYPDGTSATVGTHTHILGDAGIVLRDAGRVREDAVKNLLFIAGPHPQYLGATFCAELLP